MFLFSKLLSLHLFAFSSIGEKVSFGSAFIKWVQMPHSSLYHEKNSTRGITLSASMKYLLEKKCCVGWFFFFWKNVKWDYELLGTDICVLTMPTVLDFYYKRRGGFSPKPSKLPINIRATTIWLPCSLLYLCTSHPMPHVQMCFFQVGEAKDLRSKIITTQPPSCIWKRKVWFSILRRILNPAQSRKI